MKTEAIVLADKKENKPKKIMKKFKILAILIGITILFVVFLSYGNIEDTADLQPQAEPKRANELKKNRRKIDKNAPRVILLSQFRAGSTLVGEIFNQNPDIFYLFEPLNIITHNNVMYPYEDTYSKLLSRLCECKFSTKSAACLGNSTGAVIHSKNVAKICRRVTGIWGVECPLASPGIFRTECVKRGGNMAMKVINVDLDELESVITESQANVKIIHVVRDPRGTAHSRRFFLMSPEEKKYVKKETVDRPNDLPIRTLEEMGLFYLPTTPGKLKIDQLCRRMKLNLQTALEQPEWLKDRYMLVRFEDFTHNPIDITFNIYYFLNLEIPGSVLQWLKEISEFQDTSQFSNGASLFLPRLQVSDFDGTEWRKFTKFDDVVKTQAECRDVMNVFGYKSLVSEEEIWNYDIKVTGDLPQELRKLSVQT